jgi:sRNA-binding protein
MITAQSGAELNYAKAGHEYAQTALTDIEAAVEIARKNQIHAQTENTQAQTNLINVQIPQTRAQTEESKARTYKTITETSFIPLTTFSNVVRSLSLGSML